MVQIQLSDGRYPFVESLESPYCAARTESPESTLLCSALTARLHEPR